MYSGKTTHIWALLAIGVSIVSGLPISQVDNDELDCGPWDDEADLNASASFTTLPTPIFIQASSTTSLSPTLITPKAPGSSTGIPSSTNSFVAPANSFVPVTPPSYAFYIQSSSSSGSSNGLYAAVSAGADGSATFTANKYAATKFTIDSSGDLVEQSPSQGYVGGLNPEVNAQAVGFNAYDGSNSYGRLNCQRQEGKISCNVDGVVYQAATCGNDGRLYFMRTAAAGCTSMQLVAIVP